MVANEDFRSLENENQSAEMMKYFGVMYSFKVVHRGSARMCLRPR
jgi:hypothetical protein